MKEKLKNKKVIYTIISIMVLLIIVVGLTYAYWLVTKKQTNENIVEFGCLDISLSNESNDITLIEQFPTSDEDGMKLVPYEFTVTNNCNTSVDYQIALEAIGTESEAISSSALKVALNDNAGLFSSYAEVDTTVSGAYEARKLMIGSLTSKGSEGSSTTHELRIWIDADADISEMNKTFRSKISVTVGQGIEKQIEEGTLAYSILSNYGGEAAISEVDTTEVKERIISVYPENDSVSTSYYFGTSYTYDESTAKYSLSGNIVKKTLEECQSDSSSCLYTLKSSSSTGTSKSVFELTDFRESSALGSDYVFYTLKQIGYSTFFGAIPTDDDSGLYVADDDLGKSYYFRGNVSDNYVKFGSYSSGTSINYNNYYVFDFGWHEYGGIKTISFNEETPMYWRIVRINGDGTIRLVYDGTEKATNGTQHVAVVSSTAFTNNNEFSKYVGYTYDDGSGTQKDSIIKGVIDNWYNTNLKSNFGKYIADGIFCNDRRIDREAGEWKVYSVYKNIEESNPILTCERNEDKYSMGTDIGNGYLNNPIGLLTASEIMMAGDIYDSGSLSYKANKKSYIYSGDSFVTLTPYFSEIEEGYGTNFIYSYEGGYGLYDGPGSGARPVINLRADVKFTGNGSFETPYEIVME